ncbi:MAG: hypothetical protein LUE98_15790 [Tannerellaceae bacterium]|nr:hypothetical protein [Tannerellaceae bacterium]
MKVKKIICLFSALALLWSCEDGIEKFNPDQGGNKPDPEEPEEETVYHERAKEVFDLIQTYYLDKATGLLRENYPVQPGDNAYSYL